MIVIFGVCGKLMAGVAILAAEQGNQVVGYDRCFEPPMSDVLNHKNIKLIKGYPNQIKLNDQITVIVGNQMKRSDSIVQFLIEQRIKLYSAPEWLLEFVLRDRDVIAVAGCHGKTTITSMIAWILKESNLSPGYLIGGVHPQLGSASLGEGPFVIEADEYDTAFFDKRPKFLHYWPKYLVINCIEYDHADIFVSFKEMIRQYQYLLRLIPKSGHVFSHKIPPALNDQISAFGIANHQYDQQTMGSFANVPLKVRGCFNRLNAFAAKLVCSQFVSDDQLIDQCVSRFQSTHRRQTIVHESNYTLIDDFGHHPTAIKEMLYSFKEHERVHVVYHPATYTQRMGVLDNDAIEALNMAHQAYILLPEKHQIKIDQYLNVGINCWENIDDLVQDLKSKISEHDKVVVMSAYYLQALLGLIQEEINL